MKIPSLVFKGLVSGFAAGLTISNPVLAQSEILDAVAQVSESYALLSDIEYEHFVLGFANSQEAATYLQESNRCRIAKNFRKAAAATITKDIQSQVNDLIEYAELEPSAKSTITDSFSKNLETLSVAMQGHTVKTCVDSYVPAYSDGQTDVFVMVDDELAFAYFAGSPD